MTLLTANINSLWGSLVVEELVRHGVTQFVISPGSRSTPLVAAVANNLRARSVVHFDERAAAFFALGHAKATGAPVALICTSGTAVANYLPAVVEASVDNIPLILLTADRPAELRDTGANQTIVQPGIFSHYVRWQCDFPCPDPGMTPEYVLTSVDQAVFRATGVDAGPVHLNFQFREPLAPVDTKGSFAGYLYSIESWSTGEQPYTTYVSPELSMSADTIDQVAQNIATASRGLVVVGHLSTDTERHAVAALATRLGWPMLADIGSGLRGGEISPRIEFADAILASNRFADEHCPDMILQFGARLTSRRLLEYLQYAAPAKYVLITSTPRRLDPNHRVTQRLVGEPDAFCAALHDRIQETSPTPWYADWRLASQVVDAHVEKTFAETGDLYEPIVARLVSSGLTANSVLFLASSMAIRVMDQFADPRSSWLPVVSNRGASGIDGLIATAAGYSHGSEKPVILLIGDLAFLHDLNSLSLLRLPGVKVTVVILNNNGGAIFGHLPVAGFEDLLEKYFITPHGLSFESAAQQFHIPYHKEQTITGFETAYRNAQLSAECTIIEVPITRQANQTFHSDLLGEIAKKLNRD